MTSFKVFLLSLCAVMSIIQATKIDCDKPNTINEEHIHFCCKHPDGHNDVMEACSKETGFKLPSPTEEAMVDITAERAIANTCFGKCVFGRFNFMKADQLDMEAVKKHYTSTYPEDMEYVKEMVNAFDHCHGQAEEASAKFLSNPLFSHVSHKFCDPKPSVIWSCVVRQFFHNCPADRWAKTDECKQVLEFSKTCKDALTTI